MDPDGRTMRGRGRWRSWRKPWTWDSRLVLAGVLVLVLGTTVLMLYLTLTITN